MKPYKEKKKQQIRNRMVYNDWGLYSFVQMLVYKYRGYEDLMSHHSTGINTFSYVLKGSKIDGKPTGRS